MTATMINGTTLLGTWPRITVEQGDTVTIEPASNQPDFAVWPYKYFVTHRNGHALDLAILVDGLEIIINE